jgi:hypothetical protein
MRSILLVCLFLTGFGYSFTCAQYTTGLPKAILVDQAGRTTSTASISDFDNPVVVVVFSEQSCDSCLELISDLNRSYLVRIGSAEVKLVAIVNDVRYSASNASAYASRWKQVDVYFDNKNQLDPNRIFDGVPVMYFMDANQQVVYSHTGNVPDVYKILTLAMQIKSEDVIASGLYFDKDWWPVPEREAEYYRKAEKIAENNWLVKDYYKDGVLQMKGSASSLHPMVREGRYEYYYANGNIQSTETYKSNLSTGPAIGW